MVVLMPATTEESESSIKCVREGCKGSGSMLKCSQPKCKNHFHVICANFNSDEDALNAPDFYCNLNCKQAGKGSASNNLKAATESTVKMLEKKIEAQKLTINILIDKYQKSDERSNARQAELKCCMDRLNALEEENKRISQLEIEIAELKGKMTQRPEIKESDDEHLPTENENDNKTLETLFEQEEDEDFKRRLTAVFAKKIPSDRPASQVLSIDARNSSLSQDVNNMNETQKLAYYQRLHVQRMEAPKLMKYEGDPAQWLSFKANYDRMKEKGEYDNEAMIEKLREALDGEAEKFVRQRLNQPYANAENIMEVLRRKFFQPKEAIGKALVKLENWHQIPDKNRKELEGFLFEIDNYIYLCENLSFEPELEVAINSRITSKLPYNVETRWCSHVHEKRIKGTIRELSEFMWSFVPNLPIRPSDAGRNDPSRKNKANVQVVRTGENSKPFAAKKNKKDKLPPCWHCGGDERHYLSRCENFRKKSFEEKAKFLSSNKICSRCLSSNQHASNDCPSAKMAKCSRKNCSDPTSHCTLMHPTGAGDSNCTQQEHSEQPKRVFHMNGTNTTLFKVVPIYVIDGFGRRVETTLLMDRAAGASLVTKEFFSKLAINGQSSKLELMWLQPNATHNNSNAILHDLTIAPKHDPNRLIKLQGMYAINDVALPHQEQNPKDLKGKYPFLQKADIPQFHKQRPQILLGLPHAKWMISLETVMDFTNDSSPIAEKTPLGWTICGGLTPQKSIFHVCEVPESECSHQNEPAEEVETLEDLHQLVKHYNSFEMLGLNGTESKYLCKNDERAIEIRNKTMKQVGNRYEVGLYWNNDKCTLPDNYNTALKRLKATEARLKQIGMIKWANDHQKLLRDSGFVREATMDDLNPCVPHKRINYLIGFVTFNMNKQPPKPRWVMDAACKHDGISLNSVLLKGPDNLIPLTQAIFHFRERKIAMVSDVTKMYHQVLINKDDQQAQRFLWRDCDSTKEPKIYIFETMVFGLNCAPSQANDVRIEHATQMKEKYPEGSRIALNSMYMDDGFNSEDTEEEAVKAARQLLKMFKEISWEMVEFRSNSSTALQQLPKENVDSSLLVDLSSEDEMMAKKVLGMFWDVKKDVFMFRMTNNQELIALSLDDDYHPTKTEVLSFIMKIFDCLGIIAHFTIRGKMILQTIWRLGIGWNHHISDEIQESWKRWLEKFEEIQKLEIPRHYGYDSRYSKELTMHIFVDASLEAYAAVAFFRFITHGIVHVAQVMAKCRVAPVKYTSVPKLELMAALIGARIMNTVKKQHPRLHIQSTTFWTDSVTVLRWLYSAHIRLQQFVAPRISEIQEITNVNDWRYVPSAENVADDGTKWNDIDFSSPAQRWLKGPDFLYKDEEEWPAKFPEKVEIKEATNILVAANKTENDMYLAGTFEGITAKSRGNWNTYRTTIGWVLRFCTNLIARIRGGTKITEKFLRVNELHKAENIIFKQIQNAVYQKEIISLTRGHGVAQSSKLYSLSPFLDSEGLVRARTRMYMEESISYDMKCPPILPNKHETVHAFLQYLHVKNKHIGIEGIIAEARSRAWIIHARKAVKRVKHQCLYCIELRAKHQTPPFAPLPSYRLDPNSRPFEHCGVDCFGPFVIYSGQSRHKREVHVVVFTCMVTRAIYLRKLDHMTADEMLLAIQEVWTRRGPIRHIYSDNGRNFLGVSKIIKDAHHRQLALEKKVTWHFSPALTPHWGGVWERLIKDIKKAMKSELTKKILPEKVFECVLLQTEDIMNNRPLTHIPVSPEDLAPLTPNFLVKLHPSYAFVGGDEMPDDEDSRYYTRRARKTSEKLVKKWLKEYLPIITKQQKAKSTGKGLEIDDYVIYTDPTVKPAEWQRGRVINVYTGRDGIARVADVKLTSGKILEKRSVTRLAKLEIDHGSFDYPEIHHTISKQIERKNILLNILRKKHIKMLPISADAYSKLIFELGSIDFAARYEIKESQRGYVEEIRNFLQLEQFQDPSNDLTIKMHRLPLDFSLYDIINSFTKLNLWVTRIVADSISQQAGYMAFITFNAQSDIDEALAIGELDISGRTCKITKAKSPCNVMKLKGIEMGWICWNRTENQVQKIFVVRKKNTRNVIHAVTTLNIDLWPTFRRLQNENYVELLAEPESSPQPRVRSVIYVPPQPKVRSEIHAIPQTSQQPNRILSTGLTVADSSESDSDDDGAGPSWKFK